MRNITLSANEQLIDQARDKAQQSKTTLNAEFRKWLQQYIQTDADKKRRVQNYKALMNDFSGVSTAGKIFSRDEMNER
jgi:hypothetical protein